MVKLDNLEKEQPRIDLDTLEAFINVHGVDMTVDGVPRKTLELQAISERYKQGTKDSVSGYLVDLWTGHNFPNRVQVINDKVNVVDEPEIIEDGMVLTQKWSRIITNKLTKSLDAMGIEDTEQLQNGFFYYALTQVRTGYPKLIPIKRSEKPKETPPERFIKE